MIAQSIVNYQPLVRLDLASNRIQNTGLQNLLDSVVSLSSLRYLGLGFYKSTSDLKELPNYFDGEGAELIASFLRNNSTLLALDLKDVNLDEDGILKVVEAVKDSSSLLHIACSQMGQSSDRDTIRSIEDALAERVSKVYGLSLQEFRRGPLREIKHAESIQNIDSIYRNEM